MKLLFIHQGVDVASARVRILGLIPHLRLQGVECAEAAFPPGVAALRSLLQRDVDAIVLQKKLPSFAAGWAWRSARAPIVFDYDDALFLRQTPRGGSHVSTTRRRRFARARGLAAAFVCGNEYLASFCRESGKPVLVAPSPVPFDVPRASRAVVDRPVRIGWLGSPGNLHELAPIAPALRELATRRKIVLVVISESSFEASGVPVEHVPWRLETQEDEIAKLDIGVMPLADSPWARGKCSYKLLQYMAAGVPVVASAVGMNCEVIDAGRNGLLVSEPAGWRDALERLIENPAHAATLAAAGRATVEEKYGHAHQAQRWKDFLASI